METIREVGNWKLVQDELMGVTSFVNEKIDYQSNWNTGFEAKEEIEDVMKMTDKEFISYIMVQKDPMNTIPLPF